MTHPPTDAAHRINLSVLPGTFSVCRLNPDHDISGLIFSGLHSVTVTHREISVVCLEAQAPAAAEVEHGWKALYVNGPIPFGLTGIVAGITGAVASAKLPVFVISTFDSDLLFLRSESLEAALDALRLAGHTIAQEPE